MVSTVGVVTTAVETGNIALDAPDGIKTEVGTPATLGLLLTSDTLIPAAGAAPLIIAVPVDATPPVTLDGERVIPVNAWGDTVRLCCCEDVPMLAVTVDEPGPATAVIVNVVLL